MRELQMRANVWSIEATVQTILCQFCFISVLGERIRSLEQNSIHKAGVFLQSA
jgi:hypothetical protein